jgi:APA family basic amino acid/polyamine antiporter
VVVAVAGTALLGLFLFVHVRKDLTTEVAAWYFHSTWVWLLVMALASGVYVLKVRGLRSRGVDVDALFSTLPPE